jgi:Fe-S-cluster containining protein
MAALLASRGARGMILKVSSRDPSTSLGMTVWLVIVQNRTPPDVSLSLDEVRRIYDELATRPVERQCVRRTECCQFRLTGLTPYLTKGEALVAARALRATGRTKLQGKVDGACPMLEHHSGRCLIYAERPFGCRTHFCAAAGGPLERRDVVDLIRRLDTIDAQLGGDGPRKLPGAVTAALQDIG